MAEDHSYWYLASYPKSGNTWCRVFITELMRLAGDNPGEELNLNQDIETGAIASSRLWLDDQLGINSCDLSIVNLIRCADVLVPVRGYSQKESDFIKCMMHSSRLIPVDARW